MWGSAKDKRSKTTRNGRRADTDGTARVWKQPTTPAMSLLMMFPRHYPTVDSLGRNPVTLFPLPRAVQWGSVNHTSAGIEVWLSWDTDRTPKSAARAASQRGTHPAGFCEHKAVCSVPEFFFSRSPFLMHVRPHSPNACTPVIPHRQISSGRGTYIDSEDSPIASQHTHNATNQRHRQRRNRRQAV